MKKRLTAIITLLILIAIPLSGFSEHLWNELYIEPENLKFYYMDYLEKNFNTFDHIDYKTLLRQSSSYQDHYLEFSGTVFGFMDAGNTNAIIGIDVDDKSDQTMLCLAPQFMTWEWGEEKYKLDRLLAGDKITVRGMILGIYDFGDAGWHNIPIFYVYRMIIQI